MTFLQHSRRRSTFVAVGISLLAVPALTVVGLPGAVAAPTSAPNAPPSPGVERGRIVAAQPLYSLSQAQVTSRLTEAEFDAGTARFGVDAWRLVYRTVDVHGRPTTASGLLTVPQNRQHHLRLVSFTHGSEVYRGDAPSVSDEPWASAPAFTYASAGFAAVAPDYLGMGVGPGAHPWLHVPSEVSASIDMLRAARSFLSPRSVDRGVLLTGFSQGASAATGLARHLQNGADPWFRPAAVAPISGAYDLRNTQLRAMLSGRMDRQWSTAYTAYLLVAWNRIYNLYDSPGEVFQSPYDRTLPGLFDGEHPGSEVGAALPPSPNELLTDRGRALLERPSPAMSRALRQADTTCQDWSRPVPVRLYFSRTDEQAAPENTLRCAAALAKQGIPATLVDVGPVDHTTSNARGTAAAVRWFLKSRS